jgi:H+-transporting ATPase
MADESRRKAFEQGLPNGLTSAEAGRRLAEFGPNQMPETRERPLARALRHFWAPVPWMLEVTVVLHLASGERLEAAMVAALLLINVALDMVQEGRANATLALLRKRLAPRARVRRDSVWSDLPAAALTLGDVVQLSLGGIVPRTCGSCRVRCCSINPC